MNRRLNAGTQPFRAQSVFDNWAVVTLGWYLVCPSDALGRGEARSYTLCGQRIVVFRGDDGRARALDAFCPHMGTDLGIGRVVGDTLQCFFHHWRFDGAGTCVHVPAADRPPDRARVQAYAVDERYGFVWVWPDATAPSGVPEYPELAGQDVLTVAGKPTFYPCHHHVCMINGIDAQHLKSVHGAALDMQLTVDEQAGGRVVEYTMRGAWTDETRRERWFRRLIGPEYAYRMRYVDATIGMLTLGLEATLGPGGPPMPLLRMLFAFTPLEPGRTRVQPIYLAPRGTGVRAWLSAQARIQAQRRAYWFLKDEDGAVYSNIRFQAGALLPLDAAVAKYISWVNRLPPSRWSTTGAG